MVVCHAASASLQQQSANCMGTTSAGPGSTAACNHRSRRATPAHLFQSHLKSNPTRQRQCSAWAASSAGTLAGRRGPAVQRRPAATGQWWAAVETTSAIALVCSRLWPALHLWHVTPLPFAGSATACNRARPWLTTCTAGASLNSLSSLPSSSSCILSGAQAPEGGRGHQMDQPGDAHTWMLKAACLPYC